MSSSIQEGIETRQAAAAAKARAAFTRLAEGDSSDLAAQLDAEDSLDRLAYYVRMSRDVRETAEALEPYGSRSGNDLLRDLHRAQHGDKVAQGRLAAHRRVYSPDGIELRDLGGGTFGAIPDWMTQSQAPTAIASAPLLSYAQPLPLNAGNNLELVGFATAPVAAMQTALNASVSHTDWADSTVELPIRTSASSFTLSLQALEQGKKGIDAQVLPRTADAVNSAIDSTLINGDGNNGTCVGLRNVPSASTQTWTDSTPTAAEFISNVEQLVRKVEVGRGGSPVVIMHPRRLSWLREAASTATAPLALTWSEPRVPGAVVTLNGTVQVIADANIPTTVSTNQDVCVVLRGTEILGDIYTSGHTVFIDYNTGSATMKATVSVRRYVAASFARLPAAVGILSGTGLAAP